MSGAKIGLDFGMTNSVLYYYSEEDGPHAFHAPNSGEANGAIPTAIRKALSGNLRGALIGLASKFRMGEAQDGEIEKNFKLGLTTSGESKEERRKDKSYRAARDFLSELFREFFAHGGFEEIDTVTVTVPEAWFASLDQAGQNALRQIFQELKRAPAPQFVSEPVAAAAYFAHKYRKRNGASFDGHALVYDHGGGTLDLSFVRMRDRAVRRVDGDSLGDGKEGVSRGGAAFDRAVFEHIRAREATLEKHLAAQEDAVIDRIEEIKRRTAPHFERAFQEYYETGEIQDEYLDSIVLRGGKSVQVFASDFIRVFSADFEKPLRNRVKEFAQYCKETFPGVDFADGANFRTLMVGGFSEFYPVRRLVQAVFREEFGASNVVFQDLLNQHERWSAIARGACLIAGGSVTVDDPFPYTFGILTYDKAGAEQDNVIFERGVAQQTYESGMREIPGRFSIFSRNGDKAARLSFYVERGGRRHIVPAAAKLREVLPGADTAEYWTIARRMSKGVASVRFKNNLDKQKTLVIGHIVDLGEAELQVKVLDE